MLAAICQSYANWHNLASCGTKSQSFGTKLGFWGFILLANLWKPLMNAGVHIDFARRTFRWDSEATIKAHVHCVIVGFSVTDSNKPKIIDLNE